MKVNNIEGTTYTRSKQVDKKCKSKPEQICGVMEEGIKAKSSRNERSASHNSLR
jgi:hypothetical protein